MRRRTFLDQTTKMGLALSALPKLSAAEPAPSAARPLIMDAMGEVRAEYEPGVVRDMLASGLRAVTVTLCDPKPVGAEGFEVAMDGLLEYDRLIAKHPNWYLKATSVRDVAEAQRTGRMAIFYLFQNTAQFGKDLDRIDMFRRLGLRSCQLTYNDRNDAGAGCRAEGRLTEYGRAIIDRMNQLGMLLDLSHANMETMADAIAASRVPAVISHTACMALHRNVRNTTDANLRLLADHGGLVGICHMRPFLTSEKPGHLDAYLNHIDHAVKVAGIDAVCIGSDRDYRVITLSPEYLRELKAEEGAQVVDNDLPYFLEALNGPRRMETILQALERRKYTTDQIEQIMGRNLHRLYRDVIG